MLYQHNSADSFEHSPYQKDTSRAASKQISFLLRKNIHYGVERNLPLKQVQNQMDAVHILIWHSIYSC
jgi:hypothetical protein